MREHLEHVRVSNIEDDSIRDVCLCVGVCCLRAADMEMLRSFVWVTESSPVFCFCSLCRLRRVLLARVVICLPVHLCVYLSAVTARARPPCSEKEKRCVKKRDEFCKRRTRGTVNVYTLSGARHGRTKENSGKLK